MNRTVGGDVQQDVYTERDTAVATPDLAVNRHQLAAGVQQEPQDSPEAASHQIVVGEIPAEPPGFQPAIDLLAKLDRADAGVAVIHPVTGLRGMGTTQLVAAYARAKLAVGWRLVAWVNGADTSSLQAGLAAIADATGLADDDSGRDIADAGLAVRYLLETDGDGCLLVFDDVADFELLRRFIPAEGRSRVLITGTRRPEVSLGTGVAMDVFGAREASAFLVERTGLDDEAGASAVAAELGHLPLALSLAAPVIAGRYMGYWRYLDRLQAVPAEACDTGHDEQPYPQGVVQAVLLSWQAVREGDQTGVCTRVLEIVAALSAAGVRRELLQVAGQAGVLASGGRRAPAALVHRVLDWLSDRSLLTSSLDGQIVMMHRLVAQVVRDELVRQHRWAAVCRATAFVLEAYSVALARSQDRLAVRDIHKQVTALLDNTAGLGEEADDELAESLLRLKFVALYHLIELGDSASQAIAVGEPLIADLDRLLGPDHPDTLNSRNSLAAAYVAVGRAADAVPLFEQTLAGWQRLLGADDPDTLTSQNNLAAAYQDAGRVVDAIPLFEQTLTVRERLLGADHPSALTSRGNLAAAYQDAGRVAEAIPLFEQTLAGRERLLGPDHPDTRTSRKHLAYAYQDGGRGAEAIRLFEQNLPGRERARGLGHPDTWTSGKHLADAHQNRGRAAEGMPPSEKTSAARDSQPSADVAQALPASLRRPPADPASRVLPVGFRRPPAGPARRPYRDGVARPPPQLNNRSYPTRAPDLLSEDARYDREIVAGMTAGDPAAIARAYDRHAAALYSYCHWLLHDPADAAEALQDTFVIAVTTLDDLPEPSKLRPWLFALARNECRRRIRNTSATRDEAPKANQRAGSGQRAGAMGQPTGVADRLIDATMPFRMVSRPADAAPEPIDATMPMRVVSQQTYTADWLMDATMSFRVVRPPADATPQPIDVTMPMRAVGEPTDAGDLTYVNGDAGQAELRALISSILAGMRPREHEVIELSLRHGLYDSDLAIALGVSPNRAHAVAARANAQLEKALDALLIALTRRDSCPVLGKELAGWDGRLTKRTRNTVDLHLVQCQACADHGHGALRPAAFSRLLPSAPLPARLREEVLSRCSSTAENTAAYRRSVARRAKSTRFAQFSEATSWRWDSIRANPGRPIAALAVALWAVAALSVALLTVTGSNAAHAQAAQPTVRTASSSPAAATTTVPVTASARPSRTRRRSPTHVKPLYVPSPSPTLRTGPSPSRSPEPSESPKSSTSPSPSPAHSGSPSSSPSGSPSPSPSTTR